METINIEDLERELAEYEAETQTLKDKIEKAKEAKHTQNVEKVRQLMDELEVTLADLKPIQIQIQKVKRNVYGAGTKVAPKYRDPETGKAWAGRGATPMWLRAYVGQGRKREEFLIVSAAAAE